MVRKIVNWAAVVISLVLLAASGGWLYKEAQWAGSAPAGASEAQQFAAFTQGSIGLEVFPLKYAVVLESVSRDAFITDTEDGRSIWETYGFLPNPAANNDQAPVCVSNAAQKLPYGFNVTNYLPKSAQKTPQEFAGLTCSTCHSGTLRTADGTTTEIINGMGNPALDVIAFTDAVRNAVLDPELTTSSILEAYKTQCGNDGSGFFERQIENLLIWAWLRAARNAVGEGTAKEGLPYPGARLMDADVMPAGPSRTRPFRSIVRVILELPGEENFAYSKIPAVFEQRQDLRPRSQFDGSIGDPVTRSFVAAYASGASLVALSKPEIADNIRNAAAYTEDLGIGIGVERFKDLFSDHQPTPEQINDGLLVYQDHCQQCHGFRPNYDEPWVAEGEKLHQFSPIKPLNGERAIGTDPERVTFLYSNLVALGLTTTLPGRGDNLKSQRDSLLEAITEATEQRQPAVANLWGRHLDRLDLAARQFRLGHPLYFPENDLKDEVAYVNNPIPYAFLRAPYLHNGSIPNMRQLINLDERLPKFCRGDNIYDPATMGFITEAPDSNGVCPPRQPFVFDTTARGNSNKGHDYPWPYQGEGWDEQKLTNLLAYLKTL